MEKEKPLYGIISQNGGLFTIHFEKRDNSTNVTSQWYSVEIFRKCRKSLPIIRYDKADIDKVYANIFQNITLKKDEYLSDQENESPYLNRIKPVTTKEYLKRMKNAGFVIETVADILK